MGEGNDDDSTEQISESERIEQEGDERDFPVSRKELPGKGYRVIRFPDKWR